MVKSKNDKKFSSEKTFLINSDSEKGHKGMKVQESLTVVESDNVQTVEQLPLILMDSLHLNVKH